GSVLAPTRPARGDDGDGALVGKYDSRRRGRRRCVGSLAQTYLAEGWSSPRSPSRSDLPTRAASRAHFAAGRGEPPSARRRGNPPDTPHLLPAEAIRVPTRRAIMIAR